MPIAIQAISSHPLLVRAVEEILTDAKDFPVLPSAANEEEALSQPSLARLFLLDACSLRMDLGGPRQAGPAFPRLHRGFWRMSAPRV
jgi:hypothetical protein